jgi:hypothetical protein
MRRLAAICLPALCALALAGPAVAGGVKQLPGLTPVGHDALTRALAHGKLTEGQYALERARSLFALAGVRREFGEVAKPGPRQATPILRDLTLRLALLSPADRAEAGGIVARPTDHLYSWERHYKPSAGPVQSACDATRPLCFHWVLATGDAPPLGDADPANGIPDQIDRTIETFSAVWDLEVGAYAYRPPLPDGTSVNDEGSPDTDIYLADIGRGGLFGYCTTDDPHAFSASYRYFDVSAYCVVDDDFSPAQFGTRHTSLQFLKVTAAHEFFHAIQFAYDWQEDLWLMEGTAMLMEDQYADGVNDNRNYLANSVLTSPAAPVDTGESGFEYGAWIYWRFLVEQFDELANPLIIRGVWQRADGSSDRDGAGPDTVGQDQYSLQAARNAVSSRGLGFRTLFAKFARVNRTPQRFYQEGGSYPTAPSSASYTLGPDAPATGWKSTQLRHLASRYYVFNPASNGSAKAALRVTVDLPRPRFGPKATVLIRFADGSIRVRAIALGDAGRGSRTLPFGRTTVRAVNLVLTNASTRMNCNQNTVYSCTGEGIDDLRKYAYRAGIR